MNPSEKKIICFQVNDSCNFHCNSCHWFSDKINFVSPPSYIKYLKFLEKIDWVDRVVLSGGEPTLWVELHQLVNNIGGNIGEITVYTNGSNPKILSKITKRNLYVRLSLHLETNWSQVRNILNLIEERNWKLKVFAYTASLPTQIPDWLNIKINYNGEQSSDGFSTYHHLIGKQIYCQPRMLYFGTDGTAYCCEKGLRSKDQKYSMGFSLNSGKIHSNFRQCTVTRDCLGSFETEQFIMIEGAETEKSAWYD